VQRDGDRSRSLLRLAIDRDPDLLRDDEHPGIRLQPVVDADSSLLN
jgi:hypothetical protein